MALEGAYRYRGDHPDSVAAASALLGANLEGGHVPAGLVIGAFQLPDGSVARITAQGAGGFRAECVERPESRSIWHRFRYFVRTLLRREGGRAWTLDPRRAGEVQQWLIAFRQAERARQAAIKRQKQLDHVRKVRAASVAARFDAARAAAPTPLAALLHNILPVLDAKGRLDVTSMSVATWHAGRHERAAAVAMAMAQVAEIRSASALLDALSQAGELRDAGTLTGVQYSELLAALALRIPFLPAKERRSAVLQVAAQARRTEAAMRGQAEAMAGKENGAAAPPIHPYTRAAVIALIQVVRDNEDLYCAGAAVTDPICHLIDCLGATSDDLDTPGQRWQTYFGMMREPSRVPAIARKAWTKLVPVPSAWLDAVAHLHPAVQPHAVPLLVAAATATRDKTGERPEVRHEVATRWQAMADAALALADDHPLKGVALQALARHWPRAADDDLPTGAMPGVPPCQQYRDRIGAAAQGLADGQKTAVWHVLREAGVAA